MDCIEVRTSTEVERGEVFQLITKGYDPTTSIDALQNAIGTTCSDIVIRQSQRIPRIYIKDGRIQCIYKFGTVYHVSQDKISLLEDVLKY